MNTRGEEIALDKAIACAYAAKDGIVTLGALLDAAEIDPGEPPWDVGSLVFRLVAALTDRGIKQRGPSTANWRDTEYYISALRRAEKGSRYT